MQRLTGVTPYGLPLAHCNECIDSRFEWEGKRRVRLFRLVVNRTEPERESVPEANARRVAAEKAAAKKAEKAEKAAEKAEKASE